MQKTSEVRSDVLDRVIEKLATSDKVTLTIERLLDGKMRVTSNSWDGKRVFARDPVLAIRVVNSRLHVARKERHHDEWDRPVEPYDPCEAAEEIIEDVTGHGEDTNVFTELVTGNGDDVTDE